MNVLYIFCGMIASHAFHFMDFSPVVGSDSKWSGSRVMLLALILDGVIGSEVNQIVHEIGGPGTR